MTQSTMNPAHRKAAILISVLDRASADALLEKMPAEEAAQVREYVMELDEPTEHEAAEVIREFLSNEESGWNDVEGGVELEPELARRIAAHETYETPAMSVAAPFEFLKMSEGHVIAKHLRTEPPAIIAAVVRHLRPKLAAEVVSELAPRQQAEVLRRVAEMGPTDEEAIRVLEQELKSRVFADLEAERNRQQGVANVATIMNAAGQRRDRLLASLTAHDADFAKLLAADEGSVPDSPPRHSRQRKAATSHDRNPLRAASTPSQPASFPFARLAELDAESLAMVLRESGTELTLLALAGAPTNVFAAVTRPLTRRESKQLQRRIAQLNPVRLSDIEHAQQEIGRITAELLHQNKIRAPQVKRFAVAA